jgi:TnpA family transposase
MRVPVSGSSFDALFIAFCKWLLFGGEGKISDNTPEDQEKRIKYNDLIANCVILNNTVAPS